jgi:hypothetical protein
MVLAASVPDVLELLVITCGAVAVADVTAALLLASNAVAALVLCDVAPVADFDFDLVSA